MKIVTIIGARPQFIKAAAISREIVKRKNLTEVLIHTGQHFDKNMSEIFFNQMDIPKPDYNLNINSVGHGAMTGRMLEEIEKILLEEVPDLVLVYGDTNSTLAGALAAQKIHIPVAHVEAGLRSFNMMMPEEVNRILTDRISSILFCPTQTAVNNLKKEGYEQFNIPIYNVGDVMYDAVLFYEKKSETISRILDELNLQTKSYVLCTVHRQENTDHPERLTSIFSALEEINKTCRVVLPLHPRTKKILEKNKIKTNLTIIEPVGYFDSIQLIKNSAMVVTDSGGMQKEAYFYKKYCITLRDETEWIELVEAKANQTVGAVKDAILAAFNNFLGKPFNQEGSLYGKGNASKDIIDIVLNDNFVK